MTATRVLVVDDSAVVRQTVAAILSPAQGFEVAVAPDPLIGLRKVAEFLPHVIVLDIEMPHMDGITFLRKVMAERPVPVVICSALSGRGAEMAMKALEAGAVDVITKPALGVRHFLEESAIQIVDAVTAAAGARVVEHASPGRASGNAQRRTELRPASAAIIAVAASTGGTEALRTILESTAVGCPPMVVVQHMPKGFTRAFAERLDQISAMRVKEAEDGEPLCPGLALIAPGDMHLRVRLTSAGYTAVVESGPLVSRHRPSADVLFRSVAQAAGPAALGIILTGMGDDGARGLTEMKDAGASTIAQDRATCVVFGMPREAMLRGAVDEVLPVHSIAGSIERWSGH